MRSRLGKRIALRHVLLAALAGSVAALAACTSLTRWAYLEVMPLKGFETHPLNPQVHFERGSEEAAALVVAHLDTAVRQIETSHGGALTTRPAVYLCATASCYQRYAFTFAARAETRPFGHTVLMQGRLLMDEARVLPILTHELSHAFWFQRGIRCHPRWWAEGLAVEASGGGGAEKASVESAVLAIREGRVFTEIDESCYERNSAARVGIEWPMFYRQASMFVGWLRARDRVAFDRSLSQLREGARLSDAFESAYAVALPQLWQEWRRHVQDSMP